MANMFLLKILKDRAASEGEEQLVSQERGFQLWKHSNFQVLIYLHCLQLAYNRDAGNAVLSDRLLKRKQSLRKGNKFSRRVAYIVQLGVRCWTKLEHATGHRSCSRLILPYVYFCKRNVVFHALESRDAGFGHQDLQRSFDHPTPTRVRDDVGQEVWDRSEEVDKSFRFLTRMFFDHLHALLFTPDLYVDGGRDRDMGPFWEKMGMYDSAEGRLPGPFGILPRFVSEPLRIDMTIVGGHLAYIPSESELDEDGDAQEEEAIHFDADECPTIFNRGKNVRKVATSTAVIVPIEFEPVQADEGTVRQSGAGSEVGRQTVLGIQTRANQEEAILSTVDDVDESTFEGNVKRVEEVMEDWCRIYDQSFTNIVECEEDAGYSLSGAVKFILTDPPYNTRSERNQANSEHDRFTTTDIKDLANVCANVLDHGGHGIILCTAIQFGAYYAEFSQQPYVALTEDEEEEPEFTVGRKRRKSAGPSRAAKKAFKVEPTPLYFFRAKGNYNQSPARRRQHHMNVMEMAIHFWKPALEGTSSADSAKYQKGGHIQTSHPSWTNVMDNIPRLPGSQFIMRKEGSDREVRERPEQKNEDMLFELLSHYTKGGDLVFDPCAGIFSTGRACLRMKSPRRFVGCDSDDVCVSESKPWLVEAFAKRLIEERPVVEVGDEVKEIATSIIRTCAGKRRQQVGRIWNAPPGCCPTQTFPPHIAAAMSVCMGDTKVFMQMKAVSVTEWPESYKAAFENMDEEGLRSAAALMNGLLLGRSRIKHPGAGFGVFTNKSVKAGEKLGHYYGTLVYRDLTREKANKIVYGEGCMGVTPKNFKKAAMNTGVKVPDDAGNHHPCWIVPAKFCMAAYINDARYQADDLEKHLAGTRRARKENIYYHTLTETNANKFKDHKLVSIIEKRNIAKNEELYGNYGSSYII